MLNYVRFRCVRVVTTILLFYFLIDWFLPETGSERRDPEQNWRYRGVVSNFAIHCIDTGIVRYGFQYGIRMPGSRIRTRTKMTVPVPDFSFIASIPVRYDTPGSKIRPVRKWQYRYRISNFSFHCNDTGTGTVRYIFLHRYLSGI